MSQFVDLRSQTGVVKDQGQRGTCVACAATSAHENIRSEGLELCIEFLHWASKRRDGLPPISEGTTLPAAIDALGENGQPPEELWPYDELRDQWVSTYQPPSAATQEAKRRRVRGGGLIQPTASSIHDSLDRGHPVVLGVRLHATWHYVAPDGRIAVPTTGNLDLGGHAVLVVGYGNEGLVIQNLWGSDWGEQGFGYLPDEYVDRFAVAAWSLVL